MPYILHNFFHPSIKVEKALLSFFGIGSFRSKQICNTLGLSKNTTLKELQSTHFTLIPRVLTHTFFTESELRRAVSEDIKRLIKIGSYKGFRHVQKLPVRGQRTRTNSRTTRKIKI